MDALLEIIGAALVLTILADVFLTVLYARVGSSVFSNRLAKLLWRAFRAVAKVLPGQHATLLSFCGPVIVVALLATWSFGLTLGIALIIYPNLATSIHLVGEGPTPTDFFTALLAAATSLSIAAGSDFVPQTAAFKLFWVFTSILGMSMITLSLTYLMQLYTALQGRNVSNLRVHLATAETGDAAELIAGLGPEGDFADATARIAEMAGDVIHVKESHHFYSVLMYFRFREPSYSVTRTLLVLIDAFSLIKSALADHRYARLKESTAVCELWHAPMRLMTSMSCALLGQLTVDEAPIDDATRDRWRRRYLAAVQRLQEAGIETNPDDDLGAEIYISLRERWDRYIQQYAEHIGFSVVEIDPVGADPDRPHHAQEFRMRLHSPV